MTLAGYWCPSSCQRVDADDRDIGVDCLICFKMIQETHDETNRRHRRPRQSATQCRQLPLRRNFTGFCRRSSGIVEKVTVLAAVRGDAVPPEKVDIALFSLPLRVKTCRATLDFMAAFAQGREGLACSMISAAAIR